VEELVQLAQGDVVGLLGDRFGWSLLPVGYRVRPPRG
jgi:hypothetical protein